MNAISNSDQALQFFRQLIFLTVREARKVSQGVSIKTKTPQGATVRTILVDDFTALAIIVWVCLLVTTLGDLFARTDLCVWKKAVWAVVVLTIPMGTLAYMALQSRAIADRKAARLLQSEPNPQPAGPFSISDEIADMDRLVPMIQHAIEIRGFLDMEDPTKIMPNMDRAGIGDETVSSEHVYAQEPNRSDPRSGDSQRFPAVAA